jgi:hypothetical protein
MKEYLEKYELHEASLLSKYKTKAADFYRKNLDLMVEGKNLQKEPDFETGREMMETTKNDKETYFAFGSDDLVKKNRFDSNRILDQNLKKGKETVYKIGNYLSNSMTHIVKKTSNLVNKKKDKEELESSEIIEKNDQKGNFSLSGISNKIGSGFWNLGSKTKTLAFSTTNFLKKTTNGLLRENKKEIEKDVEREVDKSVEKYDQYFTSDKVNDFQAEEEEPEKEINKQDYPVYKKEKVYQYQNFEKDEEEDDEVHFI